MPAMTRRRPRWPAQPPRGLRPRLAPDQVRDLGIVHLENLDAIAKGQGTEELLWQVAGGELEMRLQLELVATLVTRYGKTGKVLFSGPEYQLAKQGVDVMDALAELVDRPTAVAAADWSEREVNKMAAACARRESEAAA